jgi:hypothetical protein
MTPNPAPTGGCVTSDRRIDRNNTVRDMVYIQVFHRTHCLLFFFRPKLTPMDLSFQFGHHGDTWAWLTLRCDGTDYKLHKNLPLVVLGVSDQELTRVEADFKATSRRPDCDQFLIEKVLGLNSQFKLIQVNSYTKQAYFHQKWYKSLISSLFQ